MKDRACKALDVAQRSPVLKGKWAVVTGGNSGIGLETCRALLAGGASLVLCSRSTEAGERAAEEIRAAVPLTGNIIVVEALDLADLASVRRFVGRLADRLPVGPDILICNAGVMATPAGSSTADGFELQLGTNHIGHQALVAGLLPGMRAAELLRGPGRIVVLTSVSHKWVKLELDTLHVSGSAKLNPWVAYAQSKLACLLLAKEVAKRLQQEGSGITVAAVHPGIVFTNLTRHKGSGCMAPLVRCMLRPVSKTPQQGAATTLYACVTNGLPSGAYLEDCAVAQPGRAALDPALATALFTKTEAAIAAVLAKAPAE